MRSHFFRVAASVAALGVGSMTLVGCSKDSVKSSPETAAAAAASDTTAAAAATDTTAAATADTSAAAAADTAAASATPTTMGQAIKEDIFYTAVGAGQFLTLAKLLVLSDLIDTVKTCEACTVFAPTDAAFAKVPKETLAAVAADKEKLKKVLLYHVVEGNLTSGQIKSGDLKTVEGSTLKIVNDGIAFTANNATVALPDVAASNGMIHVIDTVLLPPDL